MKTEIAEVFAEGVVVRDVKGLEFGLPRGIVAALGNILADLGGATVVEEAKVSFTHGRPHPLAGLLLPPPEVFEGEAKALLAEAYWEDAASEGELAANADAEGQLCVIVITDEEGNTAITFGTESLQTEGSYAAIYVDLDEAKELSEALLSVDYTGAVSQDAE